MDASRISALLEPYLNEGCLTSRGVRDVGIPDAGARDARPQPMGSKLSPTQLDQISTYIDLLLRWNARINLTAIRDPEEIVPRHFGESFFLARHLFPAARVKTESAPSQLVAHSSKLVIDLGSGAGFPALPIKIWAPQIHLTMIESNHKKATFLREAARALTLTNVDVIADRAESVADGIPEPRAGDRSPSVKKAFPPADVVTFRAVEKFTRILPVARKFMAPDGRIAVLITTAQLPELESIPDLHWQVINDPQSLSRVMAIGTTKVE